MNKRLLCLTIFLCCILALCSCNDPGQPPEKVNADESVSGSASESGINKNEDYPFHRPSRPSLQSRSHIS